MGLRIQQSVKQHIEELSRRRFTKNTSFKDVMHDLTDDRRRRDLAYCFGNEDPLAACGIAFGTKNNDEITKFIHQTQSSIEFGPMCVIRPDKVGSFGATICVNEPEAVQALASLSDEAKSFISEIAFVSREDEKMFAEIEAHISHLSFPFLTSLEIRGRKGVGKLTTQFATLLAERSPNLQRFVVSADGPWDGVMKVLPHLPFLQTLEIFGDIEIQPDALSDALAQTNLQRIMLFGVDINKSLANVLGNMVNLTSLSLRGCDIKKNIFKQLVKGLIQQNNIEEFELQNCPLVDSKTLEAIQLLKSIRTLHIEGDDIDGEFLPFMNGNVIEELDLDSVKLKKSSVQWIASLPNITRLRLAFCDIDAEGAKALSQLNQLAILNIEGGRVSPAFPSLCTMKNLFRLKLDLHQDDEKTLIHAPIPKALRELDIDGVSLSVEGAEALAAWPLTGLNICSDAMYDRKPRSQIGSIGAQALAKCVTLEWLHVGCHKIEAEGVKALSCLPHLRWLHLTSNPIGKGIENLSTAPSLRVVYLDDCQLPPNAPSALSKIKTLEEIYVWDNQINDKDLLNFTNLVNLREINLVKNPISSESIDRLRNLLPYVKIVA